MESRGTSNADAFTHSLEVIVVHLRTGTGTQTLEQLRSQLGTVLLAPDQFADELAAGDVTMLINLCLDEFLELFG